MSTYLLGPRDKIIKATVMPVAMGPPYAPPPFWLQATHIVIKVKNKVPINSAKRAPKIFRDMVEKEVCLIDSNIKLEGKVNGKSREWSRILWKFRLFIRVRFIHEHVYLSFSACLLLRKPVKVAGWYKRSGFVHLLTVVRRHGRPISPSSVLGTLEISGNGST